jgi:hypothetical protein
MSSQADEISIQLFPCGWSTIFSVCDKCRGARCGSTHTCTGVPTPNPSQPRKGYKNAAVLIHILLGVQVYLQDNYSTFTRALFTEKLDKSPSPTLRDGLSAAIIGLVDTLPDPEDPGLTHAYNLTKQSISHPTKRAQFIRQFLGLAASWSFRTGPCRCWLHPSIDVDSFMDIRILH